MQRRVVYTCGQKVVLILAVVADVGMIRRHVIRVGCDGHGCPKAHLLPTRSSFAAEGGRRQQLTGAGPQVADMCARVSARFIEANPSNSASDVSPELHA